MNNNENLFKSGPFKAASGWIRGHFVCKTRLEINDLAKTFGFDHFIVKLLFCENEVLKRQTYLY